MLHDPEQQRFFGLRGTRMLPRGDNDAPSNDEVKAAVDYMVTASSGSAMDADAGRQP